MAGLPRLLTVDPTGAAARAARAAVELLDRSVIQVDIPNGLEALDEAQRGGYHLVITTIDLDSHIKGFELAIRIRQAQPETAVIVLASEDDPEADSDTMAASPFLYLRRPLDGAQFLRVVNAACSGEDIFAAAAPPATAMPQEIDSAPVPPLDINAARRITDMLINEVSAMALVLGNRQGEVLLEQGMIGYLDRDQLMAALMPMIRTTIEMSRLIGGQASVLQFYDGSTYDIFVLSVGFHHFIAIIYDGSLGGRQFGIVNRFGRRAAEDLLAVLGARAFLIERPTPTLEERPKRVKPRPEPVAEEEIQPLERAEVWQETPAPTPEPEPVRLEPISNLDLSIFDTVEAVDLSAADDLFDPERLAEIANEQRRERGPLSYDEARELGIIK